MNDFREYYVDKKIPLNVYDQAINLEPINIMDPKIETGINPLSNSGSANGFYNVEQKIIFGYNNNGNSNINILTHIYF